MAIGKQCIADLKKKARQAHRLRNEARIRARLLMEDRQKAIDLYTGSTTGKPEPMLTWKQAMAKVKVRKKLVLKPMNILWARHSNPVGA